MRWAVATRAGICAWVAAGAALGGCGGSTPKARPHQPAPTAHTQAALACERAQNAQQPPAVRFQAALPYAQAAAAHDSGYQALTVILQQLGAAASSPAGTVPVRNASLEAQLAATCSQILTPQGPPG